MSTLLVQSEWLLIAASAVSITVTFFGLRFLIGYLSKADIVDRPNDRTLHQGAIPRGGGLIIVAHWLSALLLAGLFSGRYQMFGGLMLISLMWALLSWWDDRHNLSPRIRFSTQSLIAILSVLAFGWVTTAQLGYGLTLSFSWFGAFCTVFGILWMANLYNFMDGMDGLAASQTIIAGITIGFWFWQAHDLWFAFVCTVLAASSYGFLLWNWHPAKIFMGDVGSVTLGAVFATLLVIGSTRYDFPVVSFILLFGVFIVDSSVTLSRRILRGESFWLPHKTHYYQRLAALGFGHNKIVLAAVIIMLLCSMNATLCLLYRDMIGLAIIAELALLFSAAATVVFLEYRQAK